MAQAKPQSGAVQIVINATDNASRTIRNTVNQVSEIGKTAQAQLAPVQALGDRMVKSIEPAQKAATETVSKLKEVAVTSSTVTLPAMLTFFGAVFKGFEQIQDTINAFQNNVILQTYFQGLAEEADQLTLRMNGSLTEIAGGFVQLGKIGLGKFEGDLKQISPALEETEQAATETAGALTKLSESAQSAEPKFAVWDRIAQITRTALGTIQTQVKSLQSQLQSFTLGDRIEAAFTRLSTLARGALDTIRDRLNQPQQTALPTTAIVPAGQNQSGLERLGELTRIAFQQIQAQFTQLQSRINFSSLWESGQRGLSPFTNVVTNAFNAIRERFGLLRKEFSQPLLPTSAIAPIGQAQSWFERLATVARSTLERVREQFDRLKQNANFGDVLSRLQAGLARFSEFAARVFQGVLERVDQFRQRFSQPITPPTRPLELYGETIDVAFTVVKDTIETTARAVQESTQTIETSARRAGEAIDQSFAQTGSTGGFKQLANQATQAFSEIGARGSQVANNIGQSFRQIGPQIKSAIDTADRVLLNLSDKIQKFPKQLSGALDIGSKVTGAIGLADLGNIFQVAKNGAAAFAQTTFNLTQELGLFSMGLEALKGLVLGGPYQLLIGQNVELQQQLLATRASLAATNQILDGGRTIVDPTKAIQALEGPVNAAITDLREKSLDLVGVTSKDLVPIFQIIAGYSSQVGINLKQVSDLTASTAASMGTLGIPLFQARQEISSILAGTIDMNSVLAKSLGITNQQVATWKSQGRVYEELTKRLEAFRAGNALAAQTINGVASNIQEVVDEIGRMAGEQLLKPVVDVLNVVYDYLKKNKDEIADIATIVVGNLLEGLKTISEALGVIFESTAPMARNLIIAISAGIKEVLNTIGNAIKAMKPIFDPLLTILKNMSGTISTVVVPMLQLSLTMKVLQFGISGVTGGFSIFAKLVPGLGELLFFLTGRNSSLIRTFGGLQSSIGPAGAAMLLFGQNLGVIPGAAGQATSAIARFMPILAPFAPAVVGMIPNLATWGVRLVALSKQYPALGNAINTVLPVLAANSASLGTTIQRHAALIDKYLPGTSEKLIKLTSDMGTMTEAGKIRNVVEAKFSDIMKDQVKSMALTALKFAAIAAAVFLAFQAVDKFILQNKQLMEVLSAIFQGLGRIIGMLGDYAQALGKFITTPLGMATAAATAFTVVMMTRAIPALRLFVVNMAAAGITGFVSGLWSVATAMTSMGLVTNAGAAAIGTFKATLIATGKVGLAPFAAALWAVAAPLTVVVGLLAIGGLVAYTNMLKDSTEATEMYAQQTAELSSRTIQLQQRFKNAEKAQAEKIKNGIRLSDEEYKQNKKLQAEAKVMIADIDSQLASRKAALNEAVGESNKQAIQGQINELEQRRKKLEETANNIQIAPKALQRLGTAYEQYAKDVNTALEALRNPSGDTEKYKEQAGKLLEGTQALLQAGQITSKQAIENYKLIANAEGLDKETQAKAQQAITQAIKEEGEKRVQNAEATQAEIQGKIAAGKISEIDGEKEITKAKKAELDARLDALKAAKAEEDRIRNEDLRKQLMEVERQIASAQQQLASAQGDPEAYKRAIQEQQQMLVDLKGDAQSQLGGLEQQIKQLEEEAGRKRGEDADKLFNKASDLKQQANQLKRTIADAEVKLTELDQQTQKPPALKADPNAEKAAKDTLQRLQNQRVAIQEKFQEADKESNRKFNNEKKKLDAERQKTEAEALEKEVQLRTAALDRIQRKALDETQKAATARETDIQKLLNKYAIGDEEANERRIKSDQERLKAQFEQEQKYAAELEKLPKLSNPVKEEERQAKIRQARQKTAETTKQILESELRLQEAVTAKLQARIEKQLAIRRNAIDKERLSVEGLVDAQDMLIKSLELQNRLLQSRQELQKTLSDYVEGQFALAAQLTENERRKQRLEEQAARARLTFLEQQQAYERESVQAEFEKNQAMLEREKIQLRLQKLDADQAIDEKRAELEKLKADPKVVARNPEKIEQAQREVERAQRRRGLLDQQEGLLDRQGAVDAAAFQNQMRALGLRQELDFDRARADLAQKTRSKADDRALAREFENKAYSGLNQAGEFDPPSVQQQRQAAAQQRDDENRQFDALKDAFRSGDPDQKAKALEAFNQFQLSKDQGSRATNAPAPPVQAAQSSRDEENRQFDALKDAFRSGDPAQKAKALEAFNQFQLSKGQGSSPNPSSPNPPSPNPTAPKLPTIPPPPPSLTRPDNSAAMTETSQLVNLVQQLTTIITSGFAGLSKGMGGTLSQNNTINQYFQPGDTSGEKVRKQTRQDVLNALFDVGQFAMRQQGAGNSTV